LKEKKGKKRSFVPCSIFSNNQSGLSGGKEKKKLPRDSPHNMEATSMDLRTLGAQLQQINEEDVKTVIALVQSCVEEDLKEEVYFKKRIKRDDDVRVFLQGLQENYELFKKKSGSSQQFWNALSVFTGSGAGEKNRKARTLIFLFCLLPQPSFSFHRENLLHFLPLLFS
jgi:hypothetical protein